MNSDLLLSAVGVVLIVIGFLALDWLGNRWLRALPESIKARGLFGLALDWLRGHRNSTGRTGEVQDKEDRL